MIFEESARDGLTDSPAVHAGQVGGEEENAKLLEIIRKKDLHRKCKFLGGVFRASASDGYESISFVRKLMTDSQFAFLLTHDQMIEWCDDSFLYHHIIRHYPVFEKGETADPYLLWFAGYLYKYWMNTRNIPPDKIYQILPLERLSAMFAFYHTQDWDFVIEDSTRLYHEDAFVI